MNFFLKHLNYILLAGFIGFAIWIAGPQEPNNTTIQIEEKLVPTPVNAIQETNVQEESIPFQDSTYQEYIDYGSEDYDEPVTSDNWECTGDCSGHEAGYDWANENGITDLSECGGNSDSFIEGCEAYANEYQMDEYEEQYDEYESDY